MSTLIESIATILILIFIILLVTHSLNGTAGDWISSKFHITTKPA